MKLRRPEMKHYDQVEHMNRSPLSIAGIDHPVVFDIGDILFKGYIPHVHGGHRYEVSIVFLTVEEAQGYTARYRQHGRIVKFTCTAEGWKKEKVK